MAVALGRVHPLLGQRCAQRSNVALKQLMWASDEGVLAVAGLLVLLPMSSNTAPAPGTLSPKTTPVIVCSPVAGSMWYAAPPEAVYRTQVTELTARAACLADLLATLANPCNPWHRLRRDRDLVLRSRLLLPPHR